MGRVPSTTAARAEDEPPVAPSLDAVFRDEAAFVLRTLRRLGAPPGDVEDLAQQVFLVLHVRPELLEEGTAVRALLFGIMRRVLADHRKRARPREQVSSERVAVEADQEALLERRRAREALDAALDQLDAPRREVFVLYELESLPMREVAEIAGVPLQTAYSRLHSARATMRRLLRGKERP